MQRNDSYSCLVQNWLTHSHERSEILLGLHYVSANSAQGTNRNHFIACKSCLIPFVASNFQGEISLSRGTNKTENQQCPYGTGTYQERLRLNGCTRSHCARPWQEQHKSSFCRPFAGVTCVHWSNGNWGRSNRRTFILYTYSSTPQETLLASNRQNEWRRCCDVASKRYW